MIQFLLFVILFIIVFVIFIAASFLSAIRSFLGFGKKKNRAKNNDGAENEPYNTSPQNEKIFSKNEGEYVDFEEIK